MASFSYSWSSWRGCPVSVRL